MCYVEWFACDTYVLSREKASGFRVCDLYAGSVRTVACTFALNIIINIAAFLLLSCSTYVFVYKRSRNTKD